MKKVYLHQKIRMGIAACCLVVFFVLSVANAPMYAGPLTAWLNKKTTFAEMAGEISDAYISDRIWAKTQLNELNGLFARVTGRRVHKGVTMLNNEMLVYTESEPVRDMSAQARRVGEFSDYLSSLGIPFLYVLRPDKIDMGGTLLPAGLHDYSVENGTRMLEQLAENGVRTYDLREKIALTPEQMAEFFFWTDHHWTPHAAFTAFGFIVRELQQFDPTIDDSLTNVKMWQRSILRFWLLGAQGKIVGKLYDGTDHLIWYAPQFSTQMSCVIPSRGTVRRGSYVQVNIDQKYLESRNYYEDDAYNVYRDGDLPLVEYHNADAPNRKKLLLIKDTFGLPMQSMFATVFQEVDVIDPRYYTASRLAEYCADTRPDYVVLMANASLAAADSYSEFGVSEAKKIPVNGKWTKILNQFPVQLRASDDNTLNVQIPVRLQHGKTYRLSFDSISVLAGGAEGVSVAVVRQSNGALAQHQIFDVGYCNAQGGGEWTFTIPSDSESYSLLLYSGIYGQTAGTSIKMTNVVISRLD